MHNLGEKKPFYGSYKILRCPLFYTIKILKAGTYIIVVNTIKYRSFLSVAYCDLNHIHMINV